jgi:hypothetical protein
MKFFGEDEGAVCGEHRQRDLEHGIIDESDHPGDGKSERRAHKNAEAENARELQHSVRNAQVPPGRCGKRDRKEDDGRAVVDKALPFDDDLKAA